MAGGIDTSNRKPRHLRGTPALRFVNIYSLVAITGFSLVGLFFYTRPNLKRIEQRFFSDEEIAEANKKREEHAHMLGNKVIGQKSSSEIRQILRHKQKYETEL